MKQAFITMLTMQNRMNEKVHPQWVEQNYQWFRALWIECGELVDHYGYKWWKKQTPDMPQVQLEVIDIWHFGMSALFKGESIEAIADGMVAALEAYQYNDIGVIEATEVLAQDTLATKGFSVRLFWDLMHASQIDFSELYRQYVGKNVLNFFRQDNGYKEGSYIKQWQGREDNEHLVEILSSLDASSDNFADDVYQCLQQRYTLVLADV